MYRELAKGSQNTTPLAHCLPWSESLDFGQDRAQPPSPPFHPLHSNEIIRPSPTHNTVVCSKTKDPITQTTKHCSLFCFCFLQKPSACVRLRYSCAGQRVMAHWPELNLFSEWALLLSPWWCIEEGNLTPPLPPPPLCLNEFHLSAPLLRAFMALLWFGSGNRQKKEKNPLLTNLDFNVF